MLAHIFKVRPAFKWTKTTTERPAKRGMSTHRVHDRRSRVSTVTPTGTAAPPITQIRVAYSKPVQSSTFNSNTISTFTGPGGVDLHPQITSITPVTAGGVSMSFIINVNSITTLGSYTMVLEPTVLDAAGNPVDQNGDGQSNSGDRYTNVFVLNAPGTYGPDAFG